MVSVGELLSLRALFVRTLFVGSFRLRRRLVLARPSRSILPKCSAQKKFEKVRPEPLLAALRSCLQVQEVATPSGLGGFRRL